MTNKYCNLDGSKKIKDEFKKINVGFDKVEEDLKNIIVTPAEGVSEQEIIQARKGKSTLNDRLNETDNKINVTDNKVDTTKDNLNTRIDNIIATPTTVSQQEIIDARQGGASLGSNLTSIKNEVVAFKDDYMTQVSSINNLIENGDFRNQLDKWGSTFNSMNVNEGILTLHSTGNGRYFHQSIPIIKGHMYYSRMKLRTLSTTSLSVNMVATNEIIGGLPNWNSKMIFINKALEINEWTELSSVVTAPNDYPYVSFATYPNVGTNNDYEVDYMFLIDLTETFGTGNELTKEEMDILFNTSSYWEGAISNKHLMRFLLSKSGGLNDLIISEGQVWEVGV